MIEKVKKNEKKSKMLLAVLVGILVLAIFGFSFKFYAKYQENNSFDFDRVSPEGYFTDLETTQPDDDAIIP